MILDALFVRFSEDISKGEVFSFVSLLPPSQSSSHIIIASFFKIFVSFCRFSILQLTSSIFVLAFRLAFCILYTYTSIAHSVNEKKSVFFILSLSFSL